MIGCVQVRNALLAVGHDAAVDVALPAGTVDEALLSDHSGVSSTVVPSHAVLSPLCFTCSSRVSLQMDFPPVLCLSLINAQALLCWHF